MVKANTVGQDVDLIRSELDISDSCDCGDEL